MPLKDSVHPLYSIDRCLRVIAEEYRKPHIKTRCTVLSTLSFTIYQFCRNIRTPKMEGLIFLSLIRNGVLRYFDAEAYPKFGSMQQDLPSAANTESGTFSATTSFSTFVPDPPFESLKSKVIVSSVISRQALDLIVNCLFKIRCRSPITNSSSCHRLKRVHGGGILVRQKATSNVGLGRRKTKARQRRCRHWRLWRWCFEVHARADPSVKGRGGRYSTTDGTNRETEQASMTTDLERLKLCV